ncbi:MAG TPA: hypothetical protein VG406_24545 [Isosphaeraceae bacterium]|nr:hypothetical protein [Isosphaeraceae bacterium]
MRNRKRLLIVLLLLVAAGAACCLWPGGTNYPPLGSVTRVVVKAGLDNEQVRVIDDPAKVRQLVEFVDGHRRGWGGLDWAGVPVPQVVAEFYDGSKFKGHFGVGPGFFECQREGDFTSKPCRGWQQRRFLELVGLPGYEFRR